MSAQLVNLTHPNGPGPAGPGTVWWITGLAGVGKSTLGRRLWERLRAYGRCAVFLDGDSLRTALFPEVGHTNAERRDLGRRYGRLCGLLADQGHDVVCATISLHPEVWAANRERFAMYREVLVHAPLAVRARRRPTLYAPDSGVHPPAPEPPAAHLRLLNDGTRTPDELVDEILLRLASSPDSAAAEVGSGEPASSTPSSLGPVAFGTKAETLERLAPVLSQARVLPQERFTVAAWRADPDARVAALRARGWLQIPLIVRSSALDEDLPRASQAGRYPSFGGLLGEQAVRAAIDQVAAQLGRATLSRSAALTTSAEAVSGESASASASSLDDQVFVQPYLQQVRMAGVAVTRDPSNGSHYTIVSYDDRSGRTDGITSGGASFPLTYYRHRCAPGPPPEALARVLGLADELRTLLDDDALDLEFAEASDGALYLLQVRRLVPPAGPIPEAAEEARALGRIARRLVALGGPQPHLHGARAIFGTMPDWNPAEILGVRPRPLDLSLYRRLITDDVWARQRHRYGYRDVRGTPLVVSLGGLPYVDVRASFNSFVPADLDADLARRLVEAYAERLQASPVAHDKVEFAIVYSCYTLDLPERLEALGQHGFDADDRGRLASSLRGLTNRISSGPRSLLRLDLAHIQELRRRQEVLRDLRGADPVTRIHWLLEDCARHGTLAFAGIARAAFVAVQLLDSLVAAGVLGPTEREAFLGSLSTVQGRMQVDQGLLGRDEFLRRYGHLRPGTYDITSYRYDENPDAYFDSRVAARTDASSRPGRSRSTSGAFTLSDGQARRLASLLERHGLEHDPGSLLTFVREAIEGRELAKFVFTRSLSDALVALVELGAEHGLSRDALAYADIEVVERLHGGTEDPREALLDAIRAGEERFRITRQLTLPSLLSRPEEVFGFHLLPCEPSFVTQDRAEGAVVRPGAVREGSALRGAIAMLDRADPGFDWIFSHGIAGFVTMYGGYNSHMAIRACELGVPAVIGAGETLYRTWAAARRLRIDCLTRRVEVLA